MKQKMVAIIRKDLRNITTNKNLFLSLLIVPLVFTIIFPSILVCAIHFMPDDPDIQKMLELLPMSLRSGNMELDLMGMILNYILPVFFLIIPVMAASIMSASAFVGEKEKLINDIVNDRNFYTHSSNRVPVTMKFDDLLNVASLCKELYRIISLRDMGLDTEKIKQRSQTNRMCSWLMKSIMKVEIEKDTLQCGEFDNAMRLFSESK